MHVIRPITVTDAVLTASTLAEDDYAAWDVATTYAAGDRVIVPSTTLAKVSSEAWSAGQPIYWNATVSKATNIVIRNAKIGTAGEAAARGTDTAIVVTHCIVESGSDGNVGVNPISDAASTALNWIRVGSVNKWRPWDGSTGSAAEAGTGEITDDTTITDDTLFMDSVGIGYELTLASSCDAAAFFGLAGSSITLETLDASDAVTWSETQTLADTSEIVDWESYFSWSPTLQTEAVFSGFPGYVNHRLRITLNGAEMGEAVVGKLVSLGTTLGGTEIGFTDWSSKDRDDWGNVSIVEREASDTATYQFHLPIEDFARVKRELVGLRATPTAWIGSLTRQDYGMTVYGFPSGEFRIPLSADGHLFASIEIEGL